MAGVQILKTVTKPHNRKLFLAACYPSHIQQAHRVVIKQLDFDEWLKMVSLVVGWDFKIIISSFNEINFYSIL